MVNVFEREYKLYSVSDEYIEYLRKVFPNVYSNKETTRIHTRKYVGTVICLENYHYYIPMSSPKESDYQIAGEKKVIKKSIVPIMLIKNCGKSDTKYSPLCHKKGDSYCVYCNSGDER
ncbi:MAG TPA: hypothetical protein DCZ91_24875 [Lachnospiraceae bacterium]|nr:hypothetical protein [Lachnospiraceae bacterium]